MIGSFFQIAIVFSSISIMLTIASEILSGIFAGPLLTINRELATLCVGFGIFLLLIWLLYFWRISKGVFEGVITYLINKESHNQYDRYLEVVGFLFYKNKKNIRLIVWLVLTVLFPTLIIRIIISVFGLEGYWSAIGMLPAMGISISGLFFWEGVAKKYLLEKSETG